MTVAEPDQPYQHLVDAGLRVARSALSKTYQIRGSHDTQLIQAALLQLPQTGRIERLRDLAALRWIAILLEHLPEDDPARTELHRSWANAMTRARE
jgi:hypothetical protein